jgi:ubiquinone/menaquinone biosynthesis C-methylase UbiE
MERNIDNIVKDFYKKTYDEDERLTKDNAHKLELITTTTYIDKYLKNGAKILEVGAGTGAYSIHYARQGYEVDAIELSEDNLSLLKSKITPELNINAYQGNAIDLSRYDDNTFDMTLVLGPLYHVFDKEERTKVIKEAIRVTKKDGIIMYAFILTDLTILDWGFKRNELISNFGNDKMVDENYKAINKPEYVFYMSYLDEVEKELNLESITIQEYVATDGPARLIAEVVNNMDEETYNHYVNYHLSVCNRKGLIGYSGHILAIAKKK